MNRTRLSSRNKTHSAVFILVPLLALTFFGFVSEGGDAEYYLKIYRGIDTYSKVYKEITINYVDSLDPEEFMRAGIDGMLRTLDPYTVYIGEKENDEIDLITNGKYGGVGVTIGLRDGYVTVINLLEGFSAAKQGVEVGDRIIEVEGKPTKGISLEAIRQFVRGAPGTELKMKIEREGEKKPIDFVLMREEISVHNIAYAGYVVDGIGYVRLERFSRTAGEDLRNTIKDLRAKGELKGIVLDLRDNPGGLLESAVEVVSKFVPESSLVVTTHGRKSDSERRYYSSETQMLKDIPTAVLVNRFSASASEIVGGAIQDLDRGVLVGTRTFGKGLVQTISRLSENASLKITTARYYTPSGRCIQEVDYWHRDGDGNVTTKPDSLRREFRTAHNRRVWESGGILPDTIVSDTVRNMYLEELNRKSMFFKYANHFAAEKKAIPDTFEVTDAMIEDFEVFIKDKGFEYQDEGEMKLKELRTLATNARYDQSFLDGISKLEKELKSGKGEQIHRYQEDIRDALKTEILARMKGDKARFESMFATDKQLQTAINILKNKKTYDKLLGLKGR
ncbi:MAG: S41 family peptidase [Ignavibacteriales bacterium]|nr:S41 family peptidase [Ignavibacteriales bacterium]